MGITNELKNSIDEYIRGNYVELDECYEECLEVNIVEPKFERKVSKEKHSLFGNKKSQSKCAMEERIVAAPMMSFSGAAMPVAADKRKLDSLMNELGETFSQKLLRLIDDRNLKDSDVYNKAGIDRRHFSKIRNDVDYVPTKKTVFAFIIALELSLDESIDLLKCAGFSFSNSSKFDIVVKYFIENKRYDLLLVNEALDTYGLPLLGA